MTSTSKTDWGSVLALMALGLFSVVALIIVGGWLFSVAWNAFLVPTFILPAIDIGQGFAALFMAWAVGSVMGFRKNATLKEK